MSEYDDEGEFYDDNEDIVNSSLYSPQDVENEYYNCTDEETIEENYLCDLMINSKYKLEFEDKDTPCDPENIYFSTLDDAIAEAMTQSI